MNVNQRTTIHEQQTVSETQDTNIKNQQSTQTSTTQHATINDQQTSRNEQSCDSTTNN